MDAELCYCYETNTYHVYLGSELMLSTNSYVRALKRFERLCDQIEEAG